jgi:hypothetical protein
VFGWVTTKAIVHAVQRREARPGSTILFAPEHIADISRPDREYVVARYGEAFFDAST